jgi:uncharacterized phage-associated protein
MRTSVLAVAKFIIQESDRISNLKLQKLLYYVQGWHLGLKGVPLFDEDIQAWVHGPVVPIVFQIYRCYGWQPIEKHTDHVALPPNEAKHIKSVLRVYGKYAGDDLKRMSHNEEPWRIARKGIAATELSNEVISKQSMRVFFESKSRT